MEPEEFNRLYLGSWEPDPRKEELYKKLGEYYAHSETLSNREAAFLWRKFKEWAKDCGFTQADVNRAKKQHNF